jgi:hypothetical protein
VDVVANWLDTISGVTAPSAVRKQNQADDWAGYASYLAAALRAGTPLREITVYGPVFRPDERAFFQTSVNYACLYGGDGTYNTTSLLALGSPAFMLGSLAASGIINHRRKARARRNAAVRWRDYQRAGLIATSHRLMLHTDRGWATYAYGAITEFYPDVENSTVTLGFGDQHAPILLNGSPGRAVAVLVAAATMPDRWAQDPRLSAVFDRPAGNVGLSR